jgi:hypothetical protein
MLSGIDGAGVNDWAGSPYERHELRSVFSLGAALPLRRISFGIGRMRPPSRSVRRCAARGSEL